MALDTMAALLALVVRLISGNGTTLWVVVMS